MRAIFVFNSIIREDFIFKIVDGLKERFEAKDSDPLELQIMFRSEKKRLEKEITRIYETDDNVVLIFENISGYKLSPIVEGQLKDLINKGKLEVHFDDPQIIISKDISPSEMMKYQMMLTFKEYSAKMMSSSIKKSLINEKL
jgi:hypothetical protein